jgi:hypothetical protein
MKPIYVVTTGILFGLVTVAHLLRKRPRLENHHGCCRRALGVGVRADHAPGALKRLDRLRLTGDRTPTRCSDRDRSRAALPLLEGDDRHRASRTEKRPSSRHPRAPFGT